MSTTAIMDRIAALKRNESLCISRPGYEDGRLRITLRASGMQQAEVDLSENASPEQLEEALAKVLGVDA